MISGGTLMQLELTYYNDQWFPVAIPNWRSCGKNLINSYYTSNNRVGIFDLRQELKVDYKLLKT